MTTHAFTIIASGLTPEQEDYEDRFFEAGCDDATLSFQKGVIVAEFSREAASFAEAVASAYADMRRAGAQVERVEPDHLVSLSDIAERAGLSRQAISLYSNGERGEHFPNPVARVMTTTPLWDWRDVAEWLHARGQLDAAAVAEARVVREANFFLELGEEAAGDLEERLERVEG